MNNSNKLSFFIITTTPLYRPLLIPCTMRLCDRHNTRSLTFKYFPNDAHTTPSRSNNAPLRNDHTSLRRPLTRRNSPKQLHSRAHLYPMQFHGEQHRRIYTSGAPRAIFYHPRQQKQLAFPSFHSSKKGFIGNQAAGSSRGERPTTFDRKQRSLFRHCVGLYLNQNNGHEFL